MSSIAVIGPDGAGKTTITRMLEASGILRFKYLYMGVNTTSSNVALPTSRLAERLKRGRASRGRLRATARLVNRLAEAWFRQSLSWAYQLAGCVVLYDRHFLFDFAEEVARAAEGGRSARLDRRLHRWVLRRFYPRPDLVIFLDAPGEVLFARKGESTPEELERRRQALLRVGREHPRFVPVDAARALPDVYEEVVRLVLGHRPIARRLPAAEAAR